MATLILPPEELKRMIRRRRAAGGDRYDEVWDGVYVMSPLADNVHQAISSDLVVAIKAGFDFDRRVQAFVGCNVTDRADLWRKNYRCPDVAVFLPGNPAEDRGSHWLGGPDFAAEVVSLHDRSRKKFDFYAKVGVRDLLLVERRAWKLTYYHRDSGDWSLVGSSEAEHSHPLHIASLGLILRLIPGDLRPLVEVTRPRDGASWLA